MSARKVAKALARRDRAIAKAHAEFRRTLVRVHGKGMPVGQIAEAAGLTRQRIYQLLDRSASHDEGRGDRMRNARRTIVVLGVLAVAVAVALPAGLLTGSHRNARSLALSPSFRETTPGRDNAAGFGAEGDRKNGFAQEDYENRAYPAAAVQFAQVQTGQKAAARIRTASVPGQSFNWNEVGPGVFSSQALSTQTYGPPTEWSGRITALAVSPTCNAHGSAACRMYVAAAGGGVWRTDTALSANPNWKNITDNQFASTAIGSILIDPTDATSNRIYVGTGEENGSSDSEAGVGLYRSTNGGNTWALLHASTAVSYNRAIGAIAVDRTNQSRIFIGTIEARHGLSSQSGGRFTPPNAPLMGIYMSSDGGATWSPSLIQPQDTVNPASPTGGDTQFGGVTEIQQDPSNPQYLYAGMPGYGLWRSTDGGATWGQIFTDTVDVVNSGSTPRRYEFAVARLANGNTRIYLYEGGGSASSENFFRIDDARAAAITNASWTKLDSNVKADPGYFVDNICGGQCWYDLVVSSPPGQPDTVVVGGVMFYSELITRGNPAWSNGRAVVRSTDAGQHWTDMTGDNTPRAGGYLWNYENLHPDQHAIAFDPANPNVIFFGMDGGLTRTDGQWDDQSADCTSSQRQLFAPIADQNLTNCQAILSLVPHKLITMNRGLATLQFQSLGVNPNNPMSDALGGTQDNGTPAFTGGPNWILTMSGDGGDSGIDVGNGNTRFHTYTGTQTETNFHGNDQETWDWTGDTMIFSGETAAFYAPMLQDPVTPGQIFAGMNHVWRTQDSGGSQSFLDNHCNSPGIFGTSDQLFTGNCGDYVQLGDPSASSTSCGNLNSTCYGSDKRTGANSTDYVVALGRATDSSTLYAATRRGRLFVSLNGNANPASSVAFYRLDDATTPTRYISSVTVDHDHPNHVIVTFSGYNAYATAAGTATGHVFDVTVDFGSCTAAPTPHCTATWTNLDKNLGDQPALDSVYDWRTGMIYISTDWGVLKGSRGTPTWTTAGNGLPPAAVYGLNLNAVGSGPKTPRVLYAVTHGRGAWRAVLPAQ